jgi:pyruvate/2-oxoglutarate dehydrogenase complex dihydrolipoamide dehydrogenase (E3) component
MRTADRFGLPSTEPAVDFKAVMARVRSVVMDVYEEESPEALRADGIDVYLGAASFVDAHTLAAGDALLTARRFLIATGAHPFIPPIPGLEMVDYLTYEGIWDLEVLPRHLLAVGAGPIGCEMSQAFRRLGSNVTLVDAQDRLLPRDEPDASRLVSGVFEMEGIDLRLNAPVTRVWHDAASGPPVAGDIHIVAGADEVVGDALLVAVGRQPNVAGLDLDKAGVAYSSKGIQTDDYLRTSQSHIYAAGDCIGGPQFTHYAGWQAVMAVRNALLPGASKGVTDKVPWTTFTDPEVAHIGLTEDQAREQFGAGVRICEWPMAQVDRARAEDDTIGLVKLILTGDNTLLGATVVAARAGEMIHEWIVGLENDLKAHDLSSIMHIYPTYSMSSMQAAYDVRMEKLMAGTSGRVIRSLLRLMRR